jgi:integrase
MLNGRLKELAMEGLSGLQGIVNKSFKEVAEEYLAISKATKRSWRRDTALLNNLKAAFGSKTLAGIGVKDVEQYKAARAEKRSPATVNRELACLKHLFNKAIHWGYARENPVRKVRLFKENNQRTRYLEPSEREKLLACCSPELRPVVVVALNTGLRLGELIALTWADIDLGKGLLHVRDSKSGEGRHVPLNAEAVEALRSLTRHIDSPRVFFSRYGKPYRSVRTGFENACKRAGVEGFRFHDLRHSFASYLVMAGVDLNTVRELMGHKTITMTLRYAHLSPEHKQAAVEKLSALWRAQDAGTAKKAANL